MQERVVACYCKKYFTQVLPAAHGFIKYHKWRHNVCAFLNVDAVGVGGREIIKVGPKNAWIMRAFAQNVAEPLANGIAQSVWDDSGLIPGETDARIYRDFGMIPGADIAWVQNGFVYHTLKDDMSQVWAHRSSYRRYGRNVLALARGMARTVRSVTSFHEIRKTPYFTDLLNRGFIYYDSENSLSIHCVALLGAIVVIIHDAIFRTRIRAILYEFCLFPLRVFLVLAIGAACGVWMQWSQHASMCW